MSECDNCLQPVERSDNMEDCRSCGKQVCTRCAPEAICSACQEKEEQQECQDCGRPCFYDYEREAYRHAAEPERGCFLIAPEKRSA